MRLFGHFILTCMLGQDPASGHGILNEVRALEAAGQFALAEETARRFLAAESAPGSRREEVTFELERLRRLRREYKLDAAELEKRLGKALKDFSHAEFERFDSEGRFDRRMIDGVARYANASVSNTFFRYPELRARRIGAEEDTLAGVLLEHIAEVEKAAKQSGERFVLPLEVEVDMTIEVTADAAKAGELVRCWMPFPRRLPHQTPGKVLQTSPDRFSLDVPTSLMRSLYLERPAEAGAPTRFRASYELVASSVAPPTMTTPRAVEPLAELERAHWTREQPPHVAFSAAIDKLVHELAGAETDRTRVARRFYDWIGDRVKYSYSTEYSTTPNIPERVLQCRYGDCGEAALLFITLCRRASIPARWQSGWAAWPGNQTMHDWAEIWFENVGWSPVDPYVAVYAATQAEPVRTKIRDFYFGGLDHFRLVANSDHGVPLNPPKPSVRSDTVDFQRGEVEAGGRNVYYDQFSYSMKIRPKADSRSR